MVYLSFYILNLVTMAHADRVAYTSEGFCMELQGPDQVGPSGFPWGKKGILLFGIGLTRETPVNPIVNFERTFV